MSRSWPAKFRDAFRGLWHAYTREKSFAVHLPLAVLVVVAAGVLRVTLVEGCILGLAITIVLAAEVFNTALEHLARAIDHQADANIGLALDMASGTVLLTAIGAAAVGGLVLGYRLMAVLGM